MTIEVFELLPDPERVIEGLRDTGYHFATSMADVVDNSISAEATKVDIKVEMEVDGVISVYIADNGYGMNREDLINAMKYGSKTRPSRLSLGKFGLGLKTASTAFCRKLSVISKNNSSDYLKGTWDLDHVARVRKWELLLSQPSLEEKARLEEITAGKNGTLVIWENIDRLIKAYDDPVGKFARTALEKKIEEIREELPIIYQRFLDKNDNRAPNVEIILNNEKINAWDPFLPTESELVGEATPVVEMDNGRTSEFTVKAYILPRKEDFTSEELAKEARISNDLQGIYVYRENRLIYGPGWFSLYSKEPHFSLIRVEFSFDHTLDDAFHIDIKKSQVILNEELRNWLKDTFLIAPRRAAEEKYRKGLKKKTTELAQSIHTSSNRNIASKLDAVSESNVEVINEEKNEVLVENKEGRSRIKIKVSKPVIPDEIHVQPVDSLEDGLLWAPTVINNQVAVNINTGHEYYFKVYLPNRNSTVIIQGLDSLLWALSEAEFDTLNEHNIKYFREMRYAVSKILRTLVEDLPDPVIEE